MESAHQIISVEAQTLPMNNLKMMGLARSVLRVVKQQTARAVYALNLMGNVFAQEPVKQMMTVERDHSALRCKDKKFV